MQVPEATTSTFVFVGLWALGSWFSTTEAAPLQKTVASEDVLKIEVSDMSMNVTKARRSEAQLMEPDVPYGYGFLQPTDNVQRTGYVSNILSSIFQIPIQTLLAVSNLVQGILSTKFGGGSMGNYAGANGYPYPPSGSYGGYGGFGGVAQLPLTLGADAGDNIV